MASETPFSVYPKSTHWSVFRGCEEMGRADVGRCGEWAAPRNLHLSTSHPPYLADPKLDAESWNPLMPSGAS